MALIYVFLKLDFQIFKIKIKMLRNDKHSKLYYIEHKIGRYIIIKITVHTYILKYQLKFKIYKIINFLTADCTKMD